MRIDKIFDKLTKKERKELQKHIKDIAELSFHGGMDTADHIAELEPCMECVKRAQGKRGEELLTTREYLAELEPECYGEGFDQLFDVMYFEFYRDLRKFDPGMDAPSDFKREYRRSDLDGIYNGVLSRSM
jgi:hypothetical protein